VSTCGPSIAEVYDVKSGRHGNTNQQQRGSEASVTLTVHHNFTRHTDRQTDRHTDRHTDRQSHVDNKRKLSDTDQVLPISDVTTAAAAAAFDWKDTSSAQTQLERHAPERTPPTSADPTNGKTHFNDVSGISEHSYNLADFSGLPRHPSNELRKS